VLPPVVASRPDREDHCPERRGCDDPENDRFPGPAHTTRAGGFVDHFPVQDRYRCGVSHVLGGGGFFRWQGRVEDRIDLACGSDHA
jgi:hypothetical protein